MINLIEMFKVHSELQGSRFALISGEKKVTYESLYKLMLFASHHLQYIEEENVILCEDGQFNFAINFCALIFTGKRVIPVGKDMSVTEIEKIKKDTRAHLFRDEIWQKYNQDFSCLPNQGVENSDVGIIQVTSGSTGMVKYCFRDLFNLTCEARNFQLRYNIKPDDRILSLCPLYHSFALGAALLTSLYSGSCLVTIPRFSPKIAISLLAEGEISYVVMVPDIARLLCLTAANKHLYHIRIPLVGAGVSTPKLYEDFYNKFNCRINCNYGSSETGAVMSGIETTPVSSIGVPLPSVEIKIKDEQGNEILDDIAQGELFVKSDAMLKYYLGRNLTLDKDGFYPMGDIVRRDKNGNYYIVGRKKALIKIGGKTVNLKLIENVIGQFPGVKKCIVYTQNINEEKIILLAMVEGVQIDENALKEFCMSKLSAISVPSHFFISEKLEKNELGKIKVVFLKNKHD